MDLETASKGARTTKHIESDKNSLFVANAILMKMTGRIVLWNYTLNFMQN